MNKRSDPDTTGESLRIEAKLAGDVDGNIQKPCITRDTVYNVHHPR